MARILLVDDEASIIKLTSFMLTSAGYEVISARNGEEALEIIKKESTNLDLIISDHIMPKMNGMELTEKVADYKIPIIMVTAMVDEFTRDIPYRLNAIDFITKPFTIETLKTRVAKALNKRSGEKIMIGNHSFFKGDNILFYGNNFVEAANEFINLIAKQTAVTIVSTNQNLNTESTVLIFDDKQKFIPELIRFSEEVGQTISDKKGGFRILVDFPPEEKELITSLNKSSLCLGDMINVYFNPQIHNQDLFDETIPC